MLRIGCSGKATDAQTFVGLRRLFLEHCRTDRGLSSHTYRAYECDIRDFQRFLPRLCSAKAIDGNVVSRYVESLIHVRHLRPSTVRRRLAALKVLFRWLEREGHVPSNLFLTLDISIRLPKRLPRALLAAEMRALLRAADGQMRKSSADRRHDARMMQFIVVALFTTGLRIGELASSNLSDVDAAAGMIRVRGKGNRERVVYLPGKRALRVLREYLLARNRIRSDSDCLLVDEYGWPRTTAHLRVGIRRLGRDASIVRRVTPHMLRHTAATQLIEAGVDIRFVQKLLGHASIATTEIYTHVANRSLRRRLEEANVLERVHRRYTS